MIDLEKPKTVGSTIEAPTISVPNIAEITPPPPVEAWGMGPRAHTLGQVILVTSIALWCAVNLVKFLKTFAPTVPATNSGTTGAAGDNIQRTMDQIVNGLPLEWLATMALFGMSLGGVVIVLFKREKRNKQTNTYPVFVRLDDAPSRRSSSSGGTGLLGIEALAVMSVVSTGSGDCGGDSSCDSCSADNSGSDGGGSGGGDCGSS